MKWLKEVEILAFDSGTTRQYDEDGRLHVLDTAISKAAVNPYRGHTIPNWKGLGLDPTKTYQMLRDPKELEKSASTFNCLPLLDEHIYITADSHREDRTIGASGSEARYVHPYLRNRLVVWPRKSIQRIEKNLQKELSSAYHYDPDMTPGVYEGIAHDGVMRNIRGNHITVVPRGRAGPDVVVGDSAHIYRPKFYGLTSTKFKGI